jgi:hypothetical protein
LSFTKRIRIPWNLDILEAFGGMIIFLQVL